MRGNDVFVMTKRRYPIARSFERKWEKEREEEREKEETCSVQFDRRNGRIDKGDIDDLIVCSF